MNCILPIVDARAMHLICYEEMKFTVIHSWHTTVLWAFIILKNKKSY